jgi:branched-chain amino acid transport system substrate-binding protein
MNKTTKTILGVVIVIILAFLVWYGVSKKPQAPVSKEPIKIGAIFDLSGPVAMYGTAYKNGIDLAIEEINSLGGVNGRKLEVIYEDDQFDAVKAVTAINKFINIDKIPIVFTSMTKISTVIAPIANRNKTILISATVFPIGNEGKYIFRDYWDMGEQAKALAQAANQENVKNIAILLLNTPECTGPFKEKFYEYFNGSIVSEEIYQYSDTDFRTQLLKIKNSRAEGLVHCGFPPDALTTLRQLYELKMNNIKIFGLQFHEEPVVSEGKQYLDVLRPINIMYPLEPSNPISAEFIKKYEHKYGMKPRIDAAYMYDDVKILAEALRVCDLKGNVANTDCIADELLKVKNYTGVAGTLSFDKNGNSIRPTLLARYENGVWQKYEIYSR